MVRVSSRRHRLTALLVVVTLVLVLKAVSRKPAALEVLVIGSTTRPALLAVARGFLATRVPTHVFTEANTDACVLCADRSTWQDSSRYDTFGAAEGVRIWSNRPDGWWCAQSRPSSALAAFLASRTSAQLPRFLLIVDDDTWVSLCRLQALLQQVESGPQGRAALYLGFAGHQFRTVSGTPPPFCYGGAGYVLNAAALAALAGPPPRGGGTSALGACNARKAGGRWCHYHSDWVIGQCLAEAANASCAWREARELFTQAANDEAVDLDACRAAGRVTCHGKLTAADMARGYQAEGWRRMRRQRASSRDVFG